MSYKIVMKQIIEKINKSWHSNPPCDQQIMLSVGKLFPLPDDYKEFMRQIDICRTLAEGFVKIRIAEKNISEKSLR